MERKFSLGGITATRQTFKYISQQEMLSALQRHGSGDWGDCCPADRAANDVALREGFRLFSVYHSHEGRKFWVVTEAERWLTTVILAEDF